MKILINDLVSSKRIHQLHCCSSHNVSAFPSASALKVINGKNTYIIPNLVIYPNSKWKLALLSVTQLMILSSLAVQLPFWEQLDPTVSRYHGNTLKKELNYTAIFNENQFVYFQNLGWKQEHVITENPPQTLVIHYWSQCLNSIPSGGLTFSFSLATSFQLVLRTVPPDSCCKVKKKVYFLKP